MPAKPFCSIPEQLEILSRRGLRVSASDGDVLLGENYYAVINGYKAPFVDRIASSSSPEERYIAGASFSDIYALYRFDAKLRELMLGYLLRCETRVKSVSAHTFCEHHPEPAAYLDMENYTTRQDYMPGQKAFVADLPKFIEELRYKAVAQRQCKPYIQHYRERYGEVPLWVLVNELTFGNVSYFFNLLPRTEQNQICKRVVHLQHRTEKSVLTPHAMRLTLRALVECRNICAHGDRLYCAKMGPVHDISLFDAVNLMGNILPPETIEEVHGSIRTLSQQFSQESPILTDVLNRFGFIK